MKIFTLEELTSYIQEKAQNPQNIITCRSRQHAANDIKKFLLLDEDIAFRIPWRGDPKFYKKGDYLHLDLRDIYGLSKDIFHKCFVSC